MLFPRFIELLLLSVVSAAPFVTEFNLNTTLWTAERTLQPHEVVLIRNNGYMEVVYADAYRALLESQGVRLDAPELDETFQELSLENQEVNLTASHLDKRCGRNQVMVTDKIYDFIGWDVQMSPVFGQGDATVFNGYSTTNSITVSGGIDLTWVKDRARNSFGIDYSRQWTTSTQISYKATVKPGNHGTIITKPRKTRRIGRVLAGCPGSFTQIGTFQADSHLTGSYRGIDWVSGSIEMCQKPQLPLTFCTGRGTFI